jgi:hypothetical protein
MASIISAFLGIPSQFKVMHWQTQSYSMHIAYGDAYDKISGLADDFLEVYMGKYGRPTLEDGESIELINIGEMDPIQYIDTVIEFLISLNQELDDSQDSDLLNIRDEMMATLNKLKYLLTLK